MSDWIMYGSHGDRLGLTKNWGDFDPLTVAVMKMDGEDVIDLWLYHRWAPDALVNLDGKGHQRWIALQGTTRIGQFGGGRVFVGPKAFLRQIDVSPKHVWLLPFLLRLPTIPVSERLAFGEEDVWAWRYSGHQFYVLGDGPIWGLYGAGNTSEQTLSALAERPNWEDGLAFLGAVGAMRLSAR